MGKVEATIEQPLYAIGVCVVAALLAWAVALRAIDTASWWMYSLFAVLVLTIIKVAYLAIRASLRKR